MNPSDDKRMNLNSIKSLSWDKHTQKGTCGCLLCLKFVMLYHKEICDGKTDEDIYWNVWHWKETLTLQKFDNLIKLTLQT